MFTTYTLVLHPGKILGIFTDIETADEGIERVANKLGYYSKPKESHQDGIKIYIFNDELKFSLYPTITNEIDWKRVDLWKKENKL